MPLPFVIDNQQHRLREALNELLAESAGKPLASTTAYFAISRPSSLNQFRIEFNFHVLDALAKVKVFLPLLRLLGQKRQKMKEKIEADLAVLDGDAEVPQAFEVLANAFHLAADEFVVLDREKQGQ